MTSECERSGRGLGESDERYSCTSECTFCLDCSAAMDAVCQSCGDELLRRPRPLSVD